MKSAAVVLVLILAFGITGCRTGTNPPQPPDTYQSGTIHISCDESFKPAIDAQVEVFQLQHPDARIIVHYKPEAACLQDFFVDSIRMVIATRGFSPAEGRLISDSLGIGPEQLTVARDLVAVVVNPAAKDTFFSMAEIRALLTGKSKENLIPVFDGRRSTSTVRFMVDSVLRGDSLSANVAAADNTIGVLDYVAKVPNAVGFVGFSWIGNPEDTAQAAYRKKLKIAYVESTDSAGAYVRPSQYFIYTSTYPMVRDLVYVLKENHQGLGNAFARFLQQADKGQLIFRRSYLMPALRTNYVRDVQLNEKINNR